MEKRAMLASAGAVVLIVATGSAALGVNLGLMQAQQEAGVGQLEIVSASAELAPPVETIVIEEEVVIPAAEVTAPAVPSPAPELTAPAVTTATTGIDATRAVGIALATVGDASLISVDGTWSSGSAIFEVQLRLPDGRLAEVEVDGTTGAVREVDFEEPPLVAAAPAGDYDDDDDGDDDDDDDDDEDDDDDDD